MHIFEIKIHWLRVPLDITFLLSTYVFVLFQRSHGKPLHRGVFCDDQSLMYPFKEETISIHHLIYGANLIILATIILVEFIMKIQSKAILLYGFKIPSPISNIYKILLMYGFGVYATEVTTFFVKNYVGRLRPFFLTLCMPDVCTNFSKTNMSRYYEHFKCTNPNYQEYVNSFDEARVSFPSGHSSYSMFAMLFLAIYLENRITWRGSKILRHILQFLAILFAVYVGLTRYVDNKHHWNDIVAGFLVGGCFAVFSAYHSGLFRRNVGADESLEKENQASMA